MGEQATAYSNHDNFPPLGGSRGSQPNKGNKKGTKITLHGINMIQGDPRGIPYLTWTKQITREGSDKLCEDNDGISLPVPSQLNQKHP